MATAQEDLEGLAEAITSAVRCDDADSGLANLRKPWWPGCRAQGAYEARRRAAIAERNARVLSRHPEAEQLTRAAANEAPGEWGVLSTVLGPVECRLMRQVHPNPMVPGLGKRCMELARAAVIARAGVLIGQQDFLGEFEDDLCRFYREASQGNSGERIWVESSALELLRLYLPVERRPLPRDLWSYSVANDLFRIEVSPASSSAFELKHISTLPRGQGIGSVVLEDLCRFADSQGRAVSCTMVSEPADFGYDPRYRARLARWYYRHGFESTAPCAAECTHEGTHARSPGTWADGEPLRRAP